MLRLALLSPALWTAVSATAAACPDCATSRTVQAAVFDERFWSQLAVVVLPLVVLSLVVGLLHRVGLPPRDGSTSQLRERHD